eukprot:scaffold3735_cov367-Prasinococcus_capsulatus_cf.AAC.2
MEAGPGRTGRVRTLCPRRVTPGCHPARRGRQGARASAAGQEDARTARGARGHSCPASGPSSPRGGPPPSCALRHSPTPATTTTATALTRMMMRPADKGRAALG